MASYAPLDVAVRRGSRCCERAVDRDAGLGRGIQIWRGEFASSSARAVSPGVRHRTAQRIRFAAPRDHRRDRYVRATRWSRDCSGAWCGRQFVLMIGIGY